MSSGGRNRNNKTPRGGSNRSIGATEITTHIKQNKSEHIHSEKTKENQPHKIAPTAEQLRIAQMIDNTQTEKVLQEKINQVVLVTGVCTDDAIVALHDRNNDVNAAIDSLLEGEDQGEWQESTKKKKKPPITKVKDESESNKENRKVDGRDKSGSKSRGGGIGGSSGKFRGRGGSRNSKDNDGNECTTTSNSGRNSFNRRGRMTNGTMLSRGRGSRGRGSSTSHSRTFQKRQPEPALFTETIDTWGPPEKVETNDTLQIEYWDDEQSTATTEDWDNEWTGSLEKTTVFSPSTSSNGANLSSVSNLSLSAVGGGLSNCTDMSSMNSVLNQVNSGNVSLSSGLSSNVDSVLSLGQNGQQLGNVASGGVSHSYPSNVSSSNSLTQGQAIDLAALLRKAAPHSTLGRIPNSQMVDTGGLTGPSLVGDVKNNLLGSISSSVADSMNSSLLPSGNPDGGVPSSSQPSYSSSAMNNSIFSTSDLGTSLTSGANDVNKVLTLSSQRAKPQRSRLPHSKIPSQAVEMPEVAMAALDMQFSGLEFGTETFDLGSEIKPLMSIPNSSMSNRDASSASAPIAKDLNALGSSLPQAQTLGPQSIPFPNQPSERKSQNPSSTLLSGSQQRSSDSASGLSDLTKKDTGTAGSGGPPSLGNLVGSVSSAHYQPTVANAAYGPKVSSFPPPPTHHFSQNSTQNYSSNTGSSGVSGNAYSGSTISGSNLVSNSGSSNHQTSSGFNSGYSSNNVQYHNNYVNVSSHSLSSLSAASKPHSNLKDPNQVNYSDSSSGISSNLGSSLSTPSGGVSSNSTGLSLNLGSPPTSPIQPTNKTSVTGKSVNNIVSGGGPPGVQRHSITQPTLNQHLPPTHHHLQQQQIAQQSQTQQLLPGPSQYVSPQQAALSGALPPPFYNVQQPAMYSLEDLQVFQQRIPHMPQSSSTLPGSRDASITSPPSYSMTDSSKFRTDQSSSPVPSTINQQGGAGGATFMTAPGNAASMAPFYMYQTMPGVPNTFPQYATPAIIQIPSNTHTGSSTSQFPGGPTKIPYGGTSAYYDTMAQTQDYKSYGSVSQGQNKSGGPNSTVTGGSNSSSDISSYKNHLSKVGRSYEKQAYHTGTPPPFNLAGSGTNAIAAAANYTPMFIPTLPATAQHHSTLMHHQLHQDGTSAGGQRGGSGGSQNKGPSKGPYTGSYWGS